MWRLLCFPCAEESGAECKTIGFYIHPDVYCAACGRPIRTDPDDVKSECQPMYQEVVDELCDKHGYARTVVQRGKSGRRWIEKNGVPVPGSECNVIVDRVQLAFAPGNAHVSAHEKK